MLPLAINLPVSALTAFIPALAAGIAVYAQDGWPGAGRLLRRAADVRLGRGAVLLLALALPPAIYVATYALMRWTSRPLPQPEVSWLSAPLVFALFWLPAAGEELGWTGVATDEPLDRWGELRAGLLLGQVWAAWHLIPFFQTGNSLNWVFWQSLWTVLSRVIIVWLYSRSGRSVFTAICFHAASNVGWALFPNNGSHYDPAVATPLAGVVVVVILLEKLNRTSHKS